MQRKGGIATLKDIPRFSCGDLLILKKKHPCGTDRFRVLRTGSDMLLVCTGCGRDMTLPRVTLEKSLKAVVMADAE